VQASDAQALLRKVEICPDDAFSARYPNELSARITIRTKDGRRLQLEQVGYEGGLGNPMSWDRTVEKFMWLSEPFADASLRNKIVDTVQTLDQHSVEDLMALMVEVSPKAVFPATHRGIQ
jgi:2-methylcitrate dehydratase